MSLTIRFDPQEPGDVANEFKFRSRKPIVLRSDVLEEDYDLEILVDRVRVIRISDEKLILRGTMTVDGDPEETKVVCKISFLEALDRGRNEADVYETKLAPLVGLRIPLYHGSFEGQILDGPAICIVIEDCGEPVSMRMGLKKMPWEFKKHLIAVFTYLHRRLGIEHGDISGSNVLERDGLPILIDYEYTKPHKCDGPKSILIGGIVPHHDEFGCDELFVLLVKLGAFNPKYIYFDMQNVPLKNVTGPVDLAKYVSPNGAFDKETLERAEETWNEWLTEMMEHWKVSKEKILRWYQKP